jgi:hypothetical protein
MLSKSTAENYKLKILLRNKDVVTGNTTLSIINMFKDLDIKLVKSFDNVYGTLYTPIRSSTTEFKHNLNNSITKYFNNICEIETPHYCLNYNSFVTLNVYKSSVTVADRTNVFTRIERNVGEIFEGDGADAQLPVFTNLSADASLFVYVR